MAISRPPFSGISTLKKTKAEPDPLSQEEFARLIEACHHQQIENIWSLAIYTGMRHGELYALAWEHIDIKAGTLVVRRNYTQAKEFTLPKTQAGTDRVIHLIQPAIDVLKNQASLTRLGKQHKVEVKLREFGRTSAHSCTFVFNPQFTTRAGKSGAHYAVTSLSSDTGISDEASRLTIQKSIPVPAHTGMLVVSCRRQPNFIAAQMGHANAQIVYTVYGAWIADNSQSQVDILNEKLAAIAPKVPQKWVASN